ncbi:polyprenyl synthetase family protein [Nocardioides zeae]|uniref:Polyprenyl synthetase family protein n=1 Tax=Nocardioides imazamoxiresistens TaxID=3231893 RepID=A0ABU3PYZ9_9ACTN|nr:polyprenyl synthetase family protein [Nocardioides zeae]MDT9594488.1 polyprenyl synthetase family protein [Nocardioides zeae]
MTGDATGTEDQTGERDGGPAGDLGARVDAALDAFLTAQETRLAPLGPDAAALLVAARESLAGGKRLRARFCHAGYLAVRPDPTPEQDAALVRVCAALEVLHASALVHDDLMDASDTRRGRPAVHRAFEGRHRSAAWAGDPEQYGAAAAILLGDLMLTWADELVRRCGLAPDEVAAALDVLDLCRSEVVAGQFLDVSVQARGRADVEEAMRVLRYKSAKYSVERPLHVGAALAGARHEQLEALSAFGLPVGEAFQLRDDQLGVFGEPAATGKPAGDDLVEGKRTVLVALALEALSTSAPGDAADLDASLGTPLSPADVTRLRAVIEASGASDRVERLIEELTATAGAALDAAALPPAAHDALRDLAAAATRRTS